MVIPEHLSVPQHFAILSRCEAGPLPKRPAEAVRFRVAEGCCNIGDTETGVGKQLATALHHNLLPDLPECRSFRLQLTLDGPFP